jgi:hypothetical protein
VGSAWPGMSCRGTARFARIVHPNVCFTLLLQMNISSQWLDKQLRTISSIELTCRLQRRWTLLCAWAIAVLSTRVVSWCSLSGMHSGCELHLQLLDNELLQQQKPQCCTPLVRKPLSHRTGRHS